MPFNKNGGIGYWFGNSNAGDLSIGVGATVALTADSEYTNLTLATNATLQTKGFRVFVKDTLTIAAGAKIENNGNDATNVTPGATLSNTVLGTGYAGGAVNAGGGMGLVGTTSSPTSIALGGGGGKGGRVGASFPGGGADWAGALGGAGRALYTKATSGSHFQPMVISYGYLITATPAILKVEGGGGGGGGGMNAMSSNAGGGGGGGGVVHIVASNIVIANGGSIQAKGGAGGHAANIDGNGAGGGGGGGGGVIIVVCNCISMADPATALNASGGTMGTSVNGGGITTEDGTYGTILIFSDSGNYEYNAALSTAPSSDI